MDSPILYKFSNKPDTPYLDSLLQMYYEGIYDNRVGIMEAFDITSNEEVLLLVGVSADENGKPECYPIARCIKAEEVTNYLSPDGNGGWFDAHDPAELEAAKENMKTIEEAIQDEPIH